MIVEVFNQRTCGNCSFNDGVCYTSYPVKYRCTFDNGYYEGFHPCHFELMPVRHAKWEPDPDCPPRHRCSNCHSNPYDNEADQILFRADFKEHLTKYCFDCGCKMDLDDNVD